MVCLIFGKKLGDEDRAQGHPPITRIQAAVQESAARPIRIASEGQSAHQHSSACRVLCITSPLAFRLVTDPSGSYFLRIQASCPLSVMKVACGGRSTGQAANALSS